MSGHGNGAVRSVPTCLACGGSLHQGSKRANADDYVCRDCQRNPAVQMRVHLMRARAQRMDFPRAWAWAWERVRWPHDTTQRREWKTVLRATKVEKTFRSAYLREAAEKPVYMADLELVA